MRTIEKLYGLIPILEDIQDEYESSKCYSAEVEQSFNKAISSILDLIETIQKSCVNN